MNAMIWTAMTVHTLTREGSGMENFMSVGAEYARKTQDSKLSEPADEEPRGDRRSARHDVHRDWHLTEAGLRRGETSLLRHA